MGTRDSRGVIVIISFPWALSAILPSPCNVGNAYRLLNANYVNNTIIRHVLTRVPRLGSRVANNNRGYLGRQSGIIMVRNERARAPAKTVRRREPPVAGGVRYPGGGGSGTVNAAECDFRWTKKKKKKHQIKRVIIANYESPKVRHRRFNHFFFRGLRTTDARSDGVRTIYAAHACPPISSAGLVCVVG